MVYRTKFSQPVLFYPQFFPPETAQIESFGKDPVFAHSGGRQSAKNGANRLDWMRCAFFRIYSGFCQNFSTAKAQIWIFLKNFKCKGMFLLLSIYSMLSSGSRDVFTGSLARLCSGVMADQSYEGR